jgi:cyclic pyranopterin phosphate synthase
MIETPMASASTSAPAVLTDSFGRSITDLRISVTERCNYRCVYCRTGQGEAQEHALYTGTELRWDDLERLTRAFVGLGIRKVRLTGGEPLLRPGLVDFVAWVAALGVTDIALTTNGHLLAPLAEPLRRAGLTRVTISLDSLQPENFTRITRVPGGLSRVLGAIDAAAAARLWPIKVNVVLLRGYNDVEIEDFARFARARDCVVRFIEFMPLEEGSLWSRDRVVPMDEIVKRISRVHALDPLPRRPGETACRYRFHDGADGEIGIVAPVTSPFCNQCTRIRVTADGKLRTCLFSLREWDLKPALREPGDAALADRIRHAVAQKEERHHIGEPEFVKPARGMVQIGG